uniref:Uncharacterized protein n=1 Tax=Anguilla anguilla TaxID=7936 RepID=A0A0E9WFD2_ANGAN
MIGECLSIAPVSCDGVLYTSPADILLRVSLAHIFLYHDCYTLNDHVFNV